MVALCHECSDSVSAGRSSLDLYRTQLVKRGGDDGIFDERPKNCAKRRLCTFAANFEPVNEFFAANICGVGMKKHKNRKTQVANVRSTIALDAGFACKRRWFRANGAFTIKEVVC
jgi:hypothetical protein